MTTFLNRSNNIKDFPFEDYCELTEDEMGEQAERHKIKAWNSWMLPQLVAYFGTWELKYNDDGQIDPSATAAYNIGSDPWKLGALAVVTMLKRSDLVKTQATPECVNYSSLCPIVMSGLKKFKNIPYEMWSDTGLEDIVPRNLLEAMFYDTPELPLDRKLELREIGLTIGSGPKAGEMHKPTSQWKLVGLKGTEIADMPALATTMFGQIWVAHPSLRTKYLVLDPLDWDSMPEPLIKDDVVAKSVYTPSNSKLPLPKTGRFKPSWL